METTNNRVVDDSIKLIGSHKKKVHKYFNGFPKFPIKNIVTTVTTYDYKTKSQKSVKSSKKIKKNFVVRLTKDPIVHNIYKFEYRIKDGSVFTGATFSENSKRLVTFQEVDDSKKIYNELNNTINLIFQEPQPQNITVTEQDYKRGFITRHFLQRSDGVILEIDADLAKMYQQRKLDINRYLYHAVPWKLTGSQQEIIQFNKKSIKESTHKLSRIQSYLSNYTEFSRI